MAISNDSVTSPLHESGQDDALSLSFGIVSGFRGATLVLAQ